MPAVPGAGAPPAGAPQGDPQGGSPQGQPPQQQGPNPAQIVQQMMHGFQTLGQLVQGGAPPAVGKALQLATKAFEAFVQEASEGEEGPEEQGAPAPGGKASPPPMPANASKNSKPANF